MTELQVIWFVLLGVLFVGYAILDGFDLGVGFWHLRAKGDDERRAMLNAVGPVWDGNEVWLLTAGGVLFGAFPAVYASVFSGFYLALMLLLLALMARAISFEFRSQTESPGWRGAWDVVFSVSSSVAILLFGVALGNILRGVPLDASGNYLGSFLTLLNPYALMIGVLGLAMLAFQGALYMVIKGSGELEARARGWAAAAGYLYLALFVVAAVVSVATQAHLLENYRAVAVLWTIPVLVLAFIAGAIVLHRRGQAGRAFLCSSLSIAVIWGLVGAGLFPRLVPALGAPGLSLTLANASSGESTLKAMLIIALFGMPLVIGYTAWVYWAFKGKVDPSHESSHY
ncbi:MAG: cytochrome d ubiquinol oxidase subunit II [Planctomycetota bacterium]|jgi:cytochrome d ubiquinol oxidase subunit II